MVANVETMMSLRENPWHGIGTVIDRPVGDLEALHLAGLNWEIELKEAFYEMPVGKSSELSRIPKCMAVTRNDTHAAIGTVSERYNPFQNHQMFEAIKNIAQGEEVTWETAGCLDNGRKVWALARINDFNICIGDDVAKTYMLVTTGHTGNMKVIMMPTTIRVVCQNTLSLALNKQELHTGFRIGHNSLMPDRIDEAIAMFQSIRQSVSTTQDAWQALANVPMTESMINAYLEVMFDQPAAPNETERSAGMRVKRVAENKSSVMEIINSGTSRVKGTADSALMLTHAVVEHLDHVAGSDRTRTRVANFGGGADMKAKAWTEAFAVAGI